jgi:arabinan endo-1,5-alpha-L-arabinosidase
MFYLLSGSLIKIKMKKSILVLLITGIAFGFYSCADIQGDGIDTIVYNGSTVPEDSAYYNPVWDFDLTDASVFQSSGPYYAMGTEKPWADGIQYVAPTLTSSNLMDWSLISQAQAFLEKPGWAEGSVTSVTGLFSKSLGMYYLFYKLGDAGLGVGDAKTPQGPYRDYGKFADKETLGVSEINDPFVYASGSNFYLFFNVKGDGVYGVKLSVKKNTLPLLDGDLFKIAGPDYSGSYIRKKGTRFQYIGTHSGQIVMGIASAIEGPYLDNSGSDLVQGTGTPLVTITNDFQEIGQCAGIQTDNQNNDWILYTAVESLIPVLPTGDTRFVLMLNRITYDGNGWPTQAIEATIGYNYPRFK